MAACPNCGFENAETAKFCSECGAQLVGRAEGRREERKVVSVVFVDLVGSTARAESSDPEDVRALLRVYHERAREQLEGFGGTVEKFIGDAVVAVFGAPVAHEDDPERAVRAALAVRGAVAGLNEAVPGRDLHVRIAVNTGEALVSLDASPEEGEGMVAGDVVNTAARLQSAAPVDGILVGEQTCRATDRAIVYREHEPVLAKGKSEPIPVWEAVEPRSRLGVDLGGQGRAGLVGRDEELSILLGALGRARRERSTQFVTLVGVPGIGKSRLLFELGRVVDEDEELITWRQGRSLPYGEGVAFWALGEIVKAQAGIYESDDADAASSKLAGAVADAVADESDAGWVLRHLQPLVGLSEHADGSDRRGEAFAAWRRFLEGVAEGGPTVFVFEDVHWADDGLLDFVDGLVDWVDGVRLLVACTARPELLDRRPGWGGGKRNSTTVSLAPLPATETARLVVELLGRPLLDAETQQALVERSAGNPLYAEEFVRMLEAGGGLDAGLPDTVQGIVAARIDLLPASEKEIVQRAAVLGKVFWSDALGSLAGIEAWQLADGLRSLERKEFVRREHRSAVAGATQHSFVHALVRDTAYSQLPRPARAELHVAAARWIESLPDDRSEDRAETLAHHYLTALDLLGASGESTSVLASEAIAPVQEAGERALALCAFRSAARYFRHALELVPEGEEPSPELLYGAGQAFAFSGEQGDELGRAVVAFEARGDIERAAEAAVMASWHGWHASGEDSASWLRRARSLVEARPPSRAKALVLAEEARRSMIAYRYETAIATAGEAVFLAREVGDEQIEADVLVTRGVARVSAGDPEGVDELRQALEVVGHRGRVASRGYVNLGVALSTIGDFQEAGRVLAQGLERAELEGDEQGAWFARGNLVGTCYSTGDWDEALRHADAFRRAPEGARYMEPAVEDTRLRIAAARGDPAAALDEMRAVVERSRAIGDEQSVWPSLLALASMARRAGLHDERNAIVAELVAALAAHESVGDPQEWHVEMMLALRDAGEHDAATEIATRIPAGPWRSACEAVLRGAYVEAADALETTGEQPIQALLRARAARAFLAEGRTAEAEAELGRARAFWHSVGAVALLRELEEILAAAS